MAGLPALVMPLRQGIAKLKHAHQVVTNFFSVIMHFKYGTYFIIISNITKISLFLSLLSYVAVNCVWGDFSDWTACSATCDGGTKTRTRIIAIPEANGGAVCTGDATETKNCETQACPAGGKIYLRQNELYIRYVLNYC